MTKLTLPDPPAIPGHFTAAPSQRQISLSWDLIPKATKYELEADGAVIDNGNSNTYVHPNLQPLTAHAYRVRASNPGGTSEWSAVLQQQTWPDPPSTPTSLSAVASIHSVDLVWDLMDGATGYEIEVDGLIVENQGVTTYIHKDLDAVSGHTYRVRAKNIGGKSSWSAPLDITTHPEIPAVPANIMTTSDQTAVTLSWYAVPYADRYELEIDGKPEKTLTENSFFHDGLDPDSKHTYRIRASNISGAGEWSKPVTMTTMPEGTDAMALTNMAAVVTNKSIILSWDTVSENARYDIEVDGKLLDNGADTIYNHTGLAPEEFHVYKILVKQGTEAGGWVAVLALSTLPNLPDAPGKMEGYAKDSSIELRWKKMDGATGYQLEIDGKTMDIADGTSYLHQGLESGTAHTYRIRATNVTGVTAWSPALQKSTTTPDYNLTVNKDGEYSFSLLGANVQDFSELHFTVTYDPNQLELVDLYEYTPARDLTSGAVPGSNLSAMVTSGKITLTINQNVVPGTSWSGEMTTLLFRSKINGTATIHVTAD
ncbi:Fibronectin type III domain protein [compost metagenome]